MSFEADYEVFCSEFILAVSPIRINIGMGFRISHTIQIKFLKIETYK